LLLPLLLPLLLLLLLLLLILLVPRVLLPLSIPPRTSEFGSDGCAIEVLIPVFTGRDTIITPVFHLSQPLHQPIAWALQS
jgi:hypothetical protein